MKTKLFKLSVILVLLNVCIFRTFAQTDTSFWFVAPYVTPLNEDNPPYPMIFHIASLGQPSTVTISMPAYPAFAPIVTNVPANQMINVDVTHWKSLLENSPGDSVLPKGIHISATSPVTVYYQVGQSINPEIFVLKGKNSLGTNFVIPGQNRYSNDLINNYYQGTAKSAIDIVATEDNTTVKVKVSQDAIIIPAVTEWKEAITYTSYGDIGSCAQCNWTCTFVQYGSELFQFTDSLISTAISVNPPPASTFNIAYHGDTIWKYNRTVYPYYIISPPLIDNTTNPYQITVTPAKVKYHAGDTITIKLNKGETYSLIAANQTGAGHLVGSIVTSDKPIAVSIKDDSVDITSLCQDLVGDQIVPVDETGTDYIAIRGDFTYSGGPEGVFITASQDSTNVTVDGILKSILNKGATYFDTITTANPLVYIKTSKPAYAFQLTGTGCEAAGSLLPQLISSGSKKVLFTRFSKDEFIIKLLATKNIDSNFYLSVNGGQQIHIDTSNFKLVPGTNYMAARIIYDTIHIPVNSQCIIENNMGSFQMGFINRTEYDAMYGCMQGYFSDFNNRCSSTIQQTRFAGCEVTLSVSPGFSKYIWTDENFNKAISETTNTLTFQITNKVKDTIVYSIASNGSCIDTVKFVVTPQAPIAGFKQNLCTSSADSIQLSFDTTQYYTGFKWIDSLKGDSIHPKINVKLNKKDTIIRLWFWDHTCIAPADSFIIKFYPKPNLLLPNDTTVCKGSPLKIYNLESNPLSILKKWSTGETTDTISPITTLSKTDSTYYKLTLTNGCNESFSDSIKVKIISLQTPVISLKNDTVFSDAQTGNQWYMTSGSILNATNSFYIPQATDDYYAIITANGCKSDKSNIIHVAITGITEKGINENLTIYPNPTSNKFTIEMDNLKEPYTLEILNTMGQVVLIKQINNPVEQVDLSGQAAGVYFVKVQTGNNTIVKKIIKE